MKKTLELAYKPPFRYDPDTQIILDTDDRQLCMIRGWSFLVKEWGSGKAFEIQDEHGQMIVRLLNNFYGKKNL